MNRLLISNREKEGASMAWKSTLTTTTKGERKAKEGEKKGELEEENGRVQLNRLRDPHLLPIGGDGSEQSNGPTSNLVEAFRHPFVPFPRDKIHRTDFIRVG